MTSFAEELAKMIECQTALVFTDELVHTELPSTAPFSPVYECGGRGLIIFLATSCFFYFLISTECPWAPQQPSCLCCDAHSLIFLPSPCNVQNRQWRVDYNVPEFGSNHHEWLCGSLGAVVRFRCLMDKTNRAPNSGYVEQTAWLMCLFGVSQSLMVELPQIRALVPFCCPHGSSVTWGRFGFVSTPVSNITYRSPHHHSA